MPMVWDASLYIRQLGICNTASEARLQVNKPHHIFHTRKHTKYAFRSTIHLFNPAAKIDTTGTLTSSEIELTEEVRSQSAARRHPEDSQTAATDDPMESTC